MDVDPADGRVSFAVGEESGRRAALERGRGQDELVLQAEAAAMRGHFMNETSISAAVGASGWRETKVETKFGVASFVSYSRSLEPNDRHITIGHLDVQGSDRSQ